jgi:hypothetical protein
MKKHGFKRAAAAAALSASALGALGSFAVMTAGTADARPIESPNCQAIWDARESALIVARVAKQQGDQKAYNEWMADARRANANYNRHCLG